MVSFKLPKLEVGGSEGRERVLENDDLLPVPFENRTWGFWTFTIFWFSAVGTVANWLGGGSFLTYGISVWDGILCQFFGYLLISFFMVINGRAGSVYHISYPVYCRSSFGVYGAYWPILNRALSACVWNGVNTVTGGQCISILLHSIFPSFARIKNHMPSNSALTSADMIGFFIFWFLTAAACFVSIPKFPWLIKGKLVAYFLSSVGMLAMALHAAGGVGDTLTAKATVHGSTKAWLIVRFTLLAAAGCSTFASNAADWQRNATKPNDPIFGQVFGFPMSNFITTLIGMIVAASSTRVYPTLIWNPLTYLSNILRDNYDASHRAGAFFISLGFGYAALFSCIFENVLPGGNDIASLAPKYLTVKRAFGIVMIITVVINPWYLLGSASIFITFVSSYQIFLFSIAAILMCDYYFVSKGRLDLAWMYTADRRGPYWYNYGINWRAIVAYCVGAGVNFAGFLQAMGAVQKHDIALTHSYYFAFITTGVAAGGTYYLLVRLFPQPNYLLNKDIPFREWSQDEVEIYAAGKGNLREIREARLEAEDKGTSSTGDVEDVDEKKVDGVRTAVLEA
ncbi:hypothetical protein TREMEDRAFT_57660 [Tremella mesenterica DSM 1558]|uniref:uncharacterized protein n=1 Tax=Tremella mesenterica (strain ATCC 24925 / CBS 8224 / DSM 1558 / NBRC 9311 / NRRL Y-6157 / RJB 2259-6 / UBC 559-6) TaxID=578456 RepID=UPI0003F4A0EC|nr:uncharacterized protein TREMEDRAFT_57660 [Tremella mesenterica DSM 1558]EIW67149.1 hypothetical protein TREMEDRAFT_57660 [Tremella mesenterica DSM 1558]